MNTSTHDKPSFHIAIVGGGRACRFFLELLQSHPLNYFDTRIIGVCDIDPQAEGFLLAKEMGIYTTDNVKDLMALKDLDAIIELTGHRDVLLELIRTRPKGIGVLEHNISRFLRNLFLKDQQLKSAEKQVLLERMATQFLIQQANERISVLNPDFLILEANDAYLKAAGKSKEEVIGKHCYEISHGLSAPCSSSRPGGVGCPLIETLRTGESAHVIHEHFLSEEYPVYCDLVTYPLKDLNGKTVRVIEIGRDLTDELSSRWEDRAKAMTDDFTKVIQEDRMISLGKLVASSVHEINNPIQGLLTYSHLMLDMLKAEALSPEEMDQFKKFLTMMSSELERCGDIVSGLLSFSRQSETKYQEVDLNEILDQIIALTSHKMAIQNIRLNKQVCTSPLIINGDVNQLQQCFLNLVFNAMEVMPQGGELGIKSQPDAHGERALVEIRDTGCGIPEEYMGHIFDPFFTTKDKGQGTGMGLAIVYGIVKNHGGNIKADSRVGEGTTFALDFPVQRIPV